MNHKEKCEFYETEFLKIAERVLKNYPKEKEMFETRMKEKNARGAYYYYSEIKEEEIVPPLTAKEKEIDKEFYGLFVN